jgi:hypothetical protein
MNAQDFLAVTLSCAVNKTKTYGRETENAKFFVEIEEETSSDTDSDGENECEYVTVFNLNSLTKT